MRVNGQYAGGIAGNNEGSGTIENCSNTAAAAANSYTVYATNGYAGGISGTNTAQASINNATVSNGVKVGVALGDASGFTPINNGRITGGSIAECEINATGESIGAVTAINNATGTVTLLQINADGYTVEKLLYCENGMYAIYDAAEGYRVFRAEDRLQYGAEAGYAAS